MNRMKRLVAFVMVLVMMISLAPATFAAGSDFNDVPTGAWYYNPVKWAVDNEITGGVGAGLFGPDNPCTRAQVVTFLWAANGKPEPASMDNPFKDVPNNAWYLQPVLWAVENGITGGTSPTTFGPNNTCTRAQVVTFLYAAQGKPEVAKAPSGFTDVASNAWYINPVLWAVENEVTGGVAANKFGPDNACTRAQVVTFLWKADQIEDAPTPPPVTEEPVTPPPVTEEPVVTPPPVTEAPVTPAPVTPAPVTPVPQLTIVEQPQNQTLAYGETAVLSVTVSGGEEPYSYQWTVDGALLSDGTEVEYLATEPGAYSCTVTDAAGTKVKSRSAVVKVNAPDDGTLTIIKNPVGGEITGSYLRLSVTVSGGEKPYSYIWHKDGDIIPGATTSICPVTEPGTYFCIVTDANNESVFSEDAVVTVPSADYTITYNIAGNDQYLQGLTIANPNPEVYSSGTGLKLKELEVPGYTFEGWFDGAGASADKVKDIPAGTSGNLELYAKWTPEVYTVTFINPLEKEAKTDTYTVNTGKGLANPSWYRYTFTGWCDQNGKILTEIPKGTTGNLTLYANWTSQRNQTIPVKTLAAPGIIEQDGQILFVYHIGRIENVPLAEIHDYQWQSGGGITWEKEVTREVTMKESNAQSIAEMVSNATTNSSSFTLSEELSQGYEISESHTDEVSTELSQTAQQEKSQSGKWSLSNSTGGSSTVTNEAGVSAKVSATASVETSASVKAPLAPGVDAEAGVKTGYSVTGEVGGHYTNTEENSKNWNSNQGFEEGYEVSQSESFSASVSRTASNTFGVTKSYDSTEAWSQTNDTAVTKEEAREYASTVEYEVGETETTTMKLTNAGATDGYYRVVSAGTIQVFAVVGYDIASRSFYTYTYSALDKDKEPVEFLDYSATTSGYDDNENGVLPFEVPMFVEEYVNSKTLMTKGLVVNTETGIVTAYTGDTEYVIIPEYISVDNHDGTYSVVQVKGIAPGAFTNKDHIIEVKLPDSVTEIPSNAFANCGSLKNVIAHNITRIGANAFQGCTSLEGFTVSKDVTYLGTNAFKDTNSVTIYASDATIAKAAFNCGAKRVTVNLADMTDSLSDYDVVVPAGVKYFEFQGGMKTYDGVRIVSEADETVVNGATLTGCAKTPLEIYSPKVTLNRVTVDASGLAMQLFADEAEVTLHDISSMTTQGSNVILCNDISVKQDNSGADTSLRLSGNMLVCGEDSGTKNLVKFSKGQIIYCDSGTFFVTFNGNGGTVSETERTASCGMPIGQLPVPTRDYHTFDGWYTQAEGGEKVTEDSTWAYAMDLTLYAHWRENGVSDWIPADQLPAGGEVVAQKWTYTETTVTESEQTSLAGYTRTGNERWVESTKGSQQYASFPGGFDHNHSFYKNLAKSQPYSNYETETSKRVVSTSWAGYIYWHWMYDCGGAKAYDRLINHQYTSKWHYFGAFTSTNGYEKTANSACTNRDCTTYYVSGRTSHADTQGSYYWLRFDYYNCNYTDYYKLFEYKKVEDKESETKVTASNTISNVQKWVQYREK